MMEINVPVVVEDFSAGDRFYFQMGSKIKLGTVSNATKDNLYALMDDNTCVSFTFRYLLAFQAKSRLIGKPLNIAELKEGTIISRMKGKKRIYASVYDLTPGVELSYQIQNQRIIRQAKQNYSGGPTLEEQMALWEIED